MRGRLALIYIAGELGHISLKIKLIQVKFEVNSSEMSAGKQI